ncbi:electron transfer flavoprotein subunit alpha/FixB family protein [Desulfofundulus thermosubterraneus]|uniref:Electron transfer flavoprotein alpha subunit apoprotein n=1 Tax=Desulfofundulus thermosubterraneus DSM 16057 TaxID=1121432 RepID=A0A1M6GRJ1_9FIRM|nr:electron transfer flavoprotein subunit alpha/FixB family protein [Desulfofundulus thermosubterraneus]SHJ12551.1 electron transfer flavoprotein alpha subunit apoprotein [Desulfofundulus thermosubterraneus DSM 16057]
MPGVWVIAENSNYTLELLSKGLEIANELNEKLVAFSFGNEELANDYISCGADEVFVLPALNRELPFEAYVPLIVAEAKKEMPEAIIVCATQRGTELASRVAAGLNTGLATGCISVRVDKGNLVMERLVFGGAAVQTVICTTRPQMAAIPPGTYEKAQPREDRRGQIKVVAGNVETKVKVVERRKKEQEEIDLTEAKIIVSVGRGFEKQEDISLARELARLLGGEVGCTRPIAEELHWLPEERYMGISGKKVKPDLYIGLGVSGQVQHVTGIRDAKIIMAVNTDENAPIFDAADYGIVGNLYDVVPKLMTEIKAALNK